MSYLTRKFRYLESHDTGLQCFIPVSCMHVDSFNPGEGQLVAHDTLEHFLCDGTIEDELMAIGAIHYIRADLGMLSDGEMFGKRYDFDVQATDLIEAWRDSMRSTVRPIRSPIAVDGHSLWSESDVATFRQRFIERAVRDYQSDAGGAQYADPEEWDAIPGACAAFFDNGIKWIRRGYRMAERRFKQRVASLNTHQEQHEAGELFWRIAKSVNDLLKHAEDYLIYDQSSLDIHVNIRRRSYSFVVNGKRIPDEHLY